MKYLFKKVNFKCIHGRFEGTGEFQGSCRYCGPPRRGFRALSEQGAPLETLVLLQPRVDLKGEALGLHYDHGISITLQKTPQGAFPVGESSYGPIRGWEIKHTVLRTLRGCVIFPCKGSADSRAFCNEQTSTQMSGTQEIIALSSRRGRWALGYSYVSAGQQRV